MMQTLPGDTIVNMLLNSLAAERYVRGPLLQTLIDELGAREDLRLAAEAAREALSSVESRTLSDAEYLARLDAIRGLLRPSRSAA